MVRHFMVVPFFIKYKDGIQVIHSFLRLEITI